MNRIEKPEDEGSPLKITFIEEARMLCSSRRGCSSARLSSANLANDNRALPSLPFPKATLLRGSPHLTSTSGRPFRRSVITAATPSAFFVLC